MGKTNWKLTLAYDGTEFHGWQIQQDALTTPTVQGALADAIHTVTGERVLPQGSGRTDAGVHAAAQVASFFLGAAIPAENFQRALNRVLPAAVRILDAEPVADGFHARHSAIAKVYRYRIFYGRVCSPFLARYAAVSRWPLDLTAMQMAGQVIPGEHDFTSFAAFDPDRAARWQNDEKDFVGANIRRIDASQWSRAALARSAADPFTEFEVGEEDSAGEIFTYTVRGNGFLHHMVRNLVGTFIEVGRGRLAPAAMAEILAARDRALAGPTAPAKGLCLVKVLY